jgi:hypothetical protein
MSRKLSITHSLLSVNKSGALIHRKKKQMIAKHVIRRGREPNAQKKNELSQRY